MIDVEVAYTRYGPMVLRRCRRLLRDEEASLDAMHDVFVALVRHAPRLEDRGLSSLLYRIATNTCLNLLRSRKRRPGDAPSDALLERIANAAEPTEGSLGRVWLEKALGRVSPSTRAMAVMHLVDGLTIEEVAAECGMSVGGVRKRFAALRDAVRELEGIP